MAEPPITWLRRVNYLSNHVSEVLRFSVASFPTQAAGWRFTAVHVVASANLATFRNTIQMPKTF